MESFIICTLYLQKTIVQPHVLSNVKCKLLPFVVTGQVFCKHPDSLKLGRRVPLNVIQDNSILSLRQQQKQNRSV